MNLLNPTKPVEWNAVVSISAATTTNSQPKWFFCDETSGELHKASTCSLDERVRKYAVLLQDNKLIAKRSCGDLIAQDAMYYGKCLATLYKSASKVNGEDQSISGNDKILHGLALAELVSYIISKSQDCNESMQLFSNSLTLSRSIQQVLHDLVWKTPKFILQT